MINLIMLWSSTGKGSQLVTQHIESISRQGLILLQIFLILSVATAIAASIWFPAIVARIAKRHYHYDWIAAPKIGPALPIAAFLFIFPVFGLFSSRSDTFWILLLTGWMGVGIVYYYVIIVRQMNTAVMKCDNSYFISKTSGMGHWINIDKLKGFSIESEMKLGGPAYIISYDTPSGDIPKRLVIYPTNFKQSSHRNLLEFYNHYK